VLRKRADNTRCTSASITVTRSRRVVRHSRRPERSSEARQQTLSPRGRPSDLDTDAIINGINPQRPIELREAHLQDGEHAVQLTLILGVSQQQQVLGKNEQWITRERQLRTDDCGHIHGHLGGDAPTAQICCKGRHEH
jgi:hypothetical protein